MRGSYCKTRKQEGVIPWHKIVMSTWCTLSETFFTVSETLRFCDWILSFCLVLTLKQENEKTQLPVLFF